MGQYVVLHMEKRMEISPILERHITRVEVRYVNGVRVEYVWTPDNADPEKTEMNRELVSRERVGEDGKVRTLTINQAIHERIKKAGIHKIRKNQHTALEVILSGSPETLNSLSKDDVNRWAEESVKWAKEQWGEENVVSAVLHCDEKTPHIHLILVPIVQGESRRTASKKRKLAQEGKAAKQYKINSERLRLSANEVYTQPRLYGYHTRYAESVGTQFGLSRGIQAEKGSFKRHQDSIEYNRQLAQEAAEKDALIKSLQADCTEAEQRLEDVEANIKQNEIMMEEQRSLIQYNKAIISNQVNNYDERKAELETIRKAIAANEATLKKQETWICVSKSIQDDALDKVIADKRAIIDNLERLEKDLLRQISDKKTELQVTDANVTMNRQQLRATAKELKEPKEGLLGYNTAEVRQYIRSVESANLLKAMYWAPQPIDVNSELRAEVESLRLKNDTMNKILQSPEELQKRIDLLKTEKKRSELNAVVEYVLQRKVKVIRWEQQSLNEGTETLIIFQDGGGIEYAAYIGPDDYFVYTYDVDRIHSPESYHNRDKSWKIWWNEGTLQTIRQQRAEAELCDRYSTKLSIMIGTEIKIINAQRENDQYLFFADNGRSYNVYPDGKVWSTADKRIQTVQDCTDLAYEKIWKNEGNLNEVNNWSISRGMHR